MSNELQELFRAFVNKKNPELERKYIFVRRIRSSDWCIYLYPDYGELICNYFYAGEDNTLYYYDFETLDELMQEFRAELEK